MCVDFAGINGLQYVSVCIYNIYYTHHHAPMQSYFTRTHTYIYTLYTHTLYVVYQKKQYIVQMKRKRERDVVCIIIYTYIIRD